jgi:hypothetical protein
LTRGAAQQSPAQGRAAGLVVTAPNGRQTRPQLIGAHLPSYTA